MAQWIVLIEGYKNVFLLIAIGFVWHFIPKKWMTGVHELFNIMPMFVKACLLGFVFWIVYATASAGPQPFIYFQF